MEEIVRRGDAAQPFIDLNHRTVYRIVKTLFKKFGYELVSTIEERKCLRKNWDRMKSEEWIKCLINHTKSANSLRVYSSISSNQSRNSVVI